MEGQRVLVFAASGGVGHVAVQLAKSLGLYTVAVAGPKNTVRRRLFTYRQLQCSMQHEHCIVQVPLLQIACCLVPVFAGDNLTLLWVQTVVRCWKATRATDKVCDGIASVAASFVVPRPG